MMSRVRTFKVDRDKQSDNDVFSIARSRDVPMFGSKHTTVGQTGPSDCRAILERLDLPMFHQGCDTVRLRSVKSRFNTVSNIGSHYSFW